MDAIVAPLAVAAFAALLIAAAARDLRHRRIPNRLCLGLVLLYPAHILASPAVDWQGGLLCAGAVFAAGWLAFSFRLCGGGDVKMASAVALWAGPALLPGMLLATAAGGGLLSLAILAEDRWRPRAAGGPDPAVTQAPATVPFGLAIAGGGGFVAARLLGWL